MKIIHTADWHIGKQLHNIDLHEDFDHFVKYFLDYIIKEKVELVLVSGDIFDTSVPSNQARKQYFNLLTSLVKLQIQVVLTAGNHDSIANIEAPKEILEYLDIYVVGDMESAQPITFGEVTIIPIPFLYDKDVRKIVAGQGELDRVEAVKQGIVNLFQSQSITVRQAYPQHLLIAMGHLFMQGVKESESERDIQVGKLAAIESERFDNLFDYVALGHIHRPQRISETVRYSGSPIPLSFSERDDKKGFVVLECLNGKLESNFVEIPKMRDFKKVSGRFSEVKEKIEAFVKPENQLLTLLDVEIIEEKEDSMVRIEVNDWLTRYKSAHCIIANFKLKFTNTENDIKSLLQIDQNISERNPRNVFIKKIGEETSDIEDLALLEESFDELFEIATNVQ
jgi:exonuclease SbcD